MKSEEKHPKKARRCPLCHASLSDGLSLRSKQTFAYRVIRQDKETCQLILAALEERLRSLQEINHDYFKNLPDEPPAPHRLLFERVVENIDNPDPVAHEAVLEAFKLYMESPAGDQAHAQGETLQQFFASYRIYQSLGGQLPKEEFYEPWSQPENN